MTAFSSWRRQRDDHLRPTIGHYAVANGTVMRLDDGFGDAEAEAAAFRGAVVCEVAPEEALEHTAAKFRWQRRACVGDAEA